MKQIGNLAFNYETGFSSFVKKEKNFKLILQIFMIVTVLITSILSSEKVRKILFEYVFIFFVPFRIKDHISQFLNDWIITKGSRSDNVQYFENVFTNYKRYVYGLIFLFTIEQLRLVMKYFYTVRKWDRFTLSYGIFENKKFLCVKKELLSTLGNVLSFGVSLFVFFVIIGFAIFKQLQKKFSFENNFMFEGVVFAFFFWLSIVIFFALHIYQRIHNYYRNYLKNNLIDQKKDAWQVVKILIWHYFVNIFSFVVIALNIPIDLFVILLLLKFVPWRLLYFKCRKEWINESDKRYFNCSCNSRFLNIV